jgi:phosphatidylserine/phosphatidylglycerophosphate/cardiolipin synthase-like enzyme
MPFSKKVRVFANCDMTLIAWQTDGKITGCRGFAIERQVRGVSGDASNGFVKTYVGFQGQTHASGEAHPSDVWPIQRYMWNDYAPSQGQEVRYRVIPMMGPATNLKQAAADECSDWSDWITVSTGQTPGFKAYFNRGIVGAQFLSRQFGSQAQFTSKLQAAINSRGANATRDFLGGPLRVALLGLLNQAKTDGTEIYAALYELNSPEIITALSALGKNCNLILGSGAFNKKAKVAAARTDENWQVRAQLKKAGKINLFDRIVGGNHFAHNKFIVFCDGAGQPATVWTGSTNTTVTGLCTQVNNGVLIVDAEIAKAYKARWDELKAAGNEYPPSLSQEGSIQAKNTLASAPITAWNVPCNKYVDLNDAQKYIKAAKQGVLFLMFNPGTGGMNGKAPSLLQDIQALATKGLYIHGVINQTQSAPVSGDPGGGRKSTIRFTKGNQLTAAVSTEAITPHQITVANKNWFHQAYHFSNVMIHSKVVVIDPFGENPVVMTGSHNMGPKASKENDDNLAIIANAPDLAAEYAVNILGVYGHYKWLYNAWKKAKDAAGPVKKGQKAPPVPVDPSYDGNVDSDGWQDWETAGENLQLTQFLMGEPITAIAQARTAASRTRASGPSAAGAKKSTAKKSTPKKSGKAKVKAGKSASKKAAKRPAKHVRAKATAKAKPAKRKRAKKPAAGKRKTAKPRKALAKKKSTSKPKKK